MHSRIAAAAFLISCLSLATVARCDSPIVPPRAVNSPAEPAPAFAPTFLNSDETDLVGKLVSAGPANSYFIVSVTKIAYGSGKVESLPAPHTKKVVVVPSTKLLSADMTELPLTFVDLVPGRDVHVILDGASSPGAPVVAHAIRVAIGSSGVPLPGNLLKDWRVESNWTLESHAIASLTATPSYLQVKLSDDSPYTWDVSLFQRPKLEPNTTYTLRYRARSDSRRFIMAITGSRLPEKQIADSGLLQTVGLAPAWKEYQTTFTTSSATVPEQAIPLAPCFQLGGKADRLHIADVSLAPGTFPSAAAESSATADGKENRVDAPDDPDSWQLFQTEAAHATLKADKDALRLDIVSSGAEPWHLQLLHPGTDLREGGRYTVTFLGRASRPRKVTISGQVQGGDFHPIGLSQSVDLTTEWKIITVDFTATNVKPGQNLVPQFFFGNDTGGANTVWLSNIELKEKL